MAEIVPNQNVFEQTSVVLPPKEQAEPLKVGQPNGSNSPEKGDDPANPYVSAVGTRCSKL